MPVMKDTLIDVTFSLELYPRDISTVGIDGEDACVVIAKGFVHREPRGRLK